MKILQKVDMQKWEEDEAEEDSNISNSVNEQIKMQNQMKKTRLTNDFYKAQRDKKKQNWNLGLNFKVIKNCSKCFLQNSVPYI